MTSQAQSALQMAAEQTPAAAPAQSASVLHSQLGGVSVLMPPSVLVPPSVVVLLSAPASAPPLGAGDGVDEPHPAAESVKLVANSATKLILSIGASCVA